MKDKVVIELTEVEFEELEKREREVEIALDRVKNSPLLAYIGDSDHVTT